MDKLLGLIEVTGSFVWTVQAENYGGNRFEKKELFQAAKGQCYPGDFEEATAALQDMCEATVRRGVVKAIAEWRNGGEPVIQVREPAPPAPPSTQTEPAPPQGNGKQYQVGEKPAPPATASANIANQDAPTTTTAKKPQTVIAERLQTAGVTPDELKQVVRFTFGVLPEGQRYTQQQYVDAFTEAEKIIKEIGLEKFRAGLANAEKPAPATAPLAESVVFSTDPAVVEARKQVSTKWPMWQTELVNVASLWCADQVKDVGALDAFLISAEVTGTTPPGRIEALLAIARHLAIGSLPSLIGYAKASKKPMSMIEADLSTAVGKPIRFALDLPADAVAIALGVMIAEAAKGAKA